MSSELNPSTPPDSSPHPDPSETFSLLVMPAPTTEAPSRFSICSSDVSASFTPEMQLLSSVRDSLDDHIAAVSDFTPVAMAPGLAQHIRDVHEQLLSSLSRAAADADWESEMIDTPEVRAVRGLPRRLSAHEVMAWCEFCWTDTGEYLVPDLTEAFDPTFNLIHSGRVPLMVERFDSGPARLLIVWDEQTHAVSRVSTLLSQESIEEAIHHLCEVLRDSSCESSSCLLYRLESSLIDHLKARGLLERSEDTEELRTTLRNTLVMRVLSFSITSDSHHTLRIQVATKDDVLDQSFIPSLHAELHIPVHQPIELEGIHIDWR